MVRFTAGLDYGGPNHTLQHTPAPGPSFVDGPRHQVDAMWRDLTGSKWLNMAADFVLTVSAVQEVFLTREEAIAEGVQHTYIDPLTKLYEVEYV
jgi:hypothetical protein